MYAVAVKMAHVVNHHMPDSVCACCSEVVAPVAYTLNGMWWLATCAILTAMYRCSVSP